MESERNQKQTMLQSWITSPFFRRCYQQKLCVRRAIYLKCRLVAKFSIRGHRDNQPQVTKSIICVSRSEIIFHRILQYTTLRNNSKLAKRSIDHNLLLSFIKCLLTFQTGLSFHFVPPWLWLLCFAKITTFVASHAKIHNQISPCIFDVLYQHINAVKV